MANIRDPVPVPVRSSSRIATAKQKTIPNENIIDIQEPYTLNTQKALEHKESSCDLPSVTFCLKKGQNFRAWFNTASYELFKEFFYETLGIQANSKTNPIWFSSINRRDEKDNSVYHVFKTFYNKKNKDDDKNPKFTISLYNKKSSILVNGKGLTSFIDDYFSPAVKMLTERFHDIKLINESLKGAIKNAKLLNLMNNDKSNKLPLCSSPTIRTPSVIAAITTPDNTDNTILSEKRNFCPVCKDIAGDDTVFCETCCEWFHPKCVNMTLEQIQKIPTNVPFNCIICCNDVKNLGSPAPNRCLPLALPLAKSPVTTAHNASSVHPLSPDIRPIARTNTIVSNPPICSAAAPVALTLNDSQNNSPIVTDSSPTVIGNQTLRSCTTNLYHQSEATIGSTTSTTMVYSMPAVTSTSSHTRKTAKQDKQGHEISKLKSYISTLEQKIKDQEHSLHIANMSKLDNLPHSALHNPPLEDPNSRYMLKIEAIEKRLQLINEQQLHMTLSNLNSKVDNIQNYIQTVIPQNPAQYVNQMQHPTLIAPPFRQQVNYLYPSHQPHVHPFWNQSRQHIPPQVNQFWGPPNPQIPQHYMYHQSPPVVIPPPTYQHTSVNCQSQATAINNQNTIPHWQGQQQAPQTRSSSGQQNHQPNGLNLANANHQSPQVESSHESSHGQQFKNSVSSSSSASGQKRQMDGCKPANTNRQSPQVRSSNGQQNTNSCVSSYTKSTSENSGDQQRPFLVQRSPPQCNRRNWDGGHRTS